MAEISKRATQVRRKQIFILAGIGCGVALLSLAGAVWLQPSKKPAQAKEETKTRTLSLAGTQAEKEAWRIQSSAELEKMSKRLEELERRNTEREKDVSTKRQEGDNATSTRSFVSPPPPPPLPAKPEASPPKGDLFSQVGTGQIVPPPSRQGGGQIIESAKTQPRIKSLAIDTVEPVPELESSKTIAGDIKNSAKKFGDEESSKRSKTPNSSADGKERLSDDDPLSYNRAGGRTADTYLPAGTFIRAALLNGLDAPTGGQAQQNPHPVLLRLEDNAQLPNSVRAALKGCFVTGSAHGDLSAERAYVRLDRLSCIDEKGGAVDVAVRGYVSGEDGKTGLRGRLITKSGQVIANALFTGVLSGFGEALRQNSMTTTTAPVTGAQTQTVNNALEYGVGTGIGKAMDRVSQYYIKLADKLFPIVEIDGARVVDVVLTRGVSIEISK